MSKKNEVNHLTVEERIEKLSNIRARTMWPSMDEDEFNEVWASEGEKCSVGINYSGEYGWIVYLAQGPEYSLTANLMNKKIDALPLPGGFPLQGHDRSNFELCAQGATLEEALTKLENLIAGIKKHRGYKIVFWDGDD